ncbi:MAG: hypothetical protein QM754_11865 [Tepidisphaeraceae bacterium]
MPARGTGDGDSASATFEVFQSETIATMGRVSRALDDLVKAVADDIQRPYDLQRLLKLDSKLCWQVFNVIRGGESLASAKHVPGAPSMNRLLAAAETAGVPAETIDAVRDAVEAFNLLVETHGKDRSSFDSIATAASSAEESASTDLYHRRNAYRSESHIWGVQVDAYVAASIIHPSLDPEFKDECSLTVRVGQRRLRSDAPVVVHRSSTHASYKMLPANVRRPLDIEAAERLNAPLLPQFSSTPLPPMQTVLQEPGWTQVEVRGGAVGRKATFNLAFGGVVHNVPYSVDDDGHRLLRQSIRFITPAGLLVKDFIVHRPTFPNLDPRLIVFPRTDGAEPPRTLASTQRLPVHAAIESFRANSPKLAVPEFPQYQDLLSYACSRMNWILADFDVYRVRLPFPVLNSIVRIEATLPD